MTANRTILYTYNADGKLSALTVKNAVTGDQVTEFVYGTTLADSGVASNELLRAKVYPDNGGMEYGYNRLGEMVEATDPAGTVHAYDYDKLGRLLHDRVTSLGSGVDGSVRRISREYEVRGMLSKISSYDNATVGSGSVVNQVELAYNDFQQLASDKQAHGGAVGSGTPAVSYAYADGSANTIRPTGVSYPNGRELSYDYGEAGGMDDVLSRITGIKDDDDSTLATYTRLGMDQVVKLDYPEPVVERTFIKQTGEPDGDAGDPYTGLDRFGRVEDIRWFGDGPLQIGGYDQVGFSEWLYGRISELIVYDSALSDLQVQSVVDYLETKYGTEEGAAELPGISGCVVWLKADAIEGLEDGDPVGVWPDASGLGNNATQLAQSKRFTYRATGGPNGHPACEADGEDDLMEVAANASLRLKELTVFAVAETLGAGTYNGWIAMKQLQSNLAWGLAVKMHASSQKPCLSLRLDGVWSDYNYNTGTPEGFNILASRYDGAEVDHWLNGQPDGTITAGGDIDTAPDDTVLERVQHGYDRAGNKRWRQNLVAAGGGQDEFYDYDGLYQLTGMQRGTLNINRTGIGGTPAKEEGFTYDPAGNWERYLMKVAGSAAVEQGRTHNEVNETVTIDDSSATVAYDPAGNMVTMPKVGAWATGQALTWDAWNRLVQIKQGGSTVATYAYDGLFRRVKKTAGGTTRHFYYSSQWQVVEERVGSSTSADQQFVWGLLGVDDLVLRDRFTSGSERLYALHDTMHVTGIVNASGTVLERYGYDAFGNTRVMDANFSDRPSSNYDWETRFCGYRWDSESELYQVRYRYLHSGLGRWLSRDPIGFLAGDPNLYRYVANCPTNWFDWLGFIKCECLLKQFFKGKGFSEEEAAKLAKETVEKAKQTWQKSKGIGREGGFRVTGEGKTTEPVFGDKWTLDQRVREDTQVKDEGTKGFVEDVLRLHTHRPATIIDRAGMSVPDIDNALGKPVRLPAAKGSEPFRATAAAEAAIGKLSGENREGMVLFDPHRGIDEPLLQPCEF